jgi:ABC-type molybdate transport system ATPase subunit
LGYDGLFGKSGARKSKVLGLIASTIQSQSGHIVLDRKILFDGNSGESQFLRKIFPGILLGKISKNVRDRLYLR